MRPALTYSLRNNESTKSDHASIANDLRFFFWGGGGGDWGVGGGGSNNDLSDDIVSRS